jgi:MFS family permease
MNRWNRIIPAAFVMYTVAYIDRTNFALAIPSLQQEFGLRAGQAGWAAGVFFLGYLLLQMPGGHLAQVWSAKKFITAALLFWGVFATACGLAQSLDQLLVFRFLLGVGEGGVWPATVVLLANWFAPHERARANGYWVLCQPVAIAISSPLSGWLIDHYGWRAMFIVQGMLPIVFAALWWWAVADRPSEASWASIDDKKVETAKRALPVAEGERWAFLRNRDVWVLMIMDFAFACGAYGLLMWLPTAIRATGIANNLVIGVISGIPYFFAMLGAIYNSRRSDRVGERRKHVAVPCLLAGACLIAGTLAGDAMLLRLVLVSATATGVYAALGPMWALMSETVPQRTAGLSLGLINAVANLGGLAGPYMGGAARDWTNSFQASFGLFGVLLMLAGVLTLLVRTPRPTLADQTY